MTQNNPNLEELAKIEQAKLNTETALMPWQDLQRFFAQGVVMQVSAQLDLLEVASKMSVDDVAAVRVWFDAGTLAHVTDEQATLWSADNAELWTVVVKPYILVQEKPQTAVPASVQTH